MFIDFQKTDREEFLALCHEFYSTPAVLHTVPDSIFEATFNEVTGVGPFARGLMIKDDAHHTVGYLLLSFTYSGEVGGLVVLLEEIYIRPQYQGKGYGKEAFAFIDREYPQKKRLRLEVTRGNQGAIRLYERMGLEVLDYVQMVKEN